MWDDGIPEKYQKIAKVTLIFLYLYYCTRQYLQTRIFIHVCQLPFVSFYVFVSQCRQKSIVSFDIKTVLKRCIRRLIFRILIWAQKSDHKGIVILLDIFAASCKKFVTPNKRSVQPLVGKMRGTFQQELFNSLTPALLLPMLTLNKQMLAE